MKDDESSAGGADIDIIVRAVVVVFVAVRAPTRVASYGVAAAATAVVGCGLLESSSTCSAEDDDSEARE